MENKEKVFCWCIGIGLVVIIIMWLFDMNIIMLSHNCDTGIASQEEGEITCVWDGEDVPCDCEFLIKSQIYFQQRNN